MSRSDADLPALGAVIREQRKRLQLTQTQLAERLSWSQERLSVLENGKYGVPSLVRLSEALELQVLEPIEVLSTSGAALNLDGSSPRPGAKSVALQYTLQRLLTIRALTLMDALDEASDQMAVAMGGGQDRRVYP